MIGFIIYELVETAWSLSKLSFNGLASAYNWYYSIPSPEEKITNQLKYLQDEIKELENKLNDFEVLTQNRNADNAHSFPKEDDKSNVDELRTKPLLK